MAEKVRTAYTLRHTVPIGYAGENETREAAFDIGKLMRQWPETTPHLVAKRPGEEEAYPCRMRMEGSTLVWEITSSDTAIAGEGEAQVIMTGPDGEVGKSEVIRTIIGPGMEGNLGETPPPAIEPYVLQVLEAADRAESAAKRAEEIAEALAGGGSGDLDSGLFLPSVGEEDNGKVLTVVNGKWSAQTPEESGVQFDTDETLTLQDGILSVNTADIVEEDNTLPVTSAAVYAEVGNINALLATI